MFATSGVTLHRTGYEDGGKIHINNVPSNQIVAKKLNTKNLKGKVVQVDKTKPKGSQATIKDAEGE